MSASTHLLAALTLVVGGAAYAGTDPDRRWLTVTTPHFALHTHDEGEVFAREVGVYAEEAYAELGAVFGWFPRERVHVLVVDDYDSANGFASVLPHPAITIWAHPPPPESELGYYANWLRLLVFHEYTHVVHLDHSGGIPALVDAVFGRVWKPNNALPRWVTEGLAVWVESSRTGGGRVGSPLTEMHFRAAAQAGRIPTLSDLTGYPLEHPRGSSWYLYGGALFDHIARHAGEAALARFVAAYGSHPIPYALNTLAREATGETLVTWFEAVRAAIEARSRASAPSPGATPTSQLRSPREVLESPVFTRDGAHLVWVEATSYDAARVVMAPAPTLAADGRVAAWPAHLEPTPLVRCEGGCGRLATSRDGLRLAFATGRHHRVATYYNHLAEVPLAVGQARRAPRVLPGSRRAYDPTPAADGRSVWAARTTWGLPELVRLDPITGEVLDRLVPPAPPEPPGPLRVRDLGRFDDPVASADGRSLYVSLHTAANRDLYHVDLVTRAFTRLTGGRSLDVDPALSPDGRWLVYASDREGAPNVYAMDTHTRAHRRLTDVVTGAFQPAVSPDGRILVFRLWTASGAALMAQPFTPEAAPEVAPELARDPDFPVERPALPDPTPTYPYQALPTMLPRSWLPTWQLDSTGLALLGVAFEGVDATNRYGLVLSADWSLDRDDWAAYASYSLRTGLPDLGFQLGRYSWDRVSIVGDLIEPWREEVVYANASIAFPVPDVFAGLTLGLGYSAELRRGLETGALVHTPDESMPVIPEEGAAGSANLFLGLGDSRQHALDITASEGLSLFTNLGLRHPALGSGATALTFTFVGRAHMRLPWEGHVLTFRLGGGLSGGDPGERSVFVLGGVPRQDLLADLLNQTSAGAVWLRGFPESLLSGTRFGMLTTEWRLPLLRARTGLGTLPVFIEDFTLAAFSDLGSASYDPDLGEDLRAGLGVELRFSLDLFYGLVSDFRVGYAHGFGPDGLDHVYVLMGPSP